ncbi:MAG: hypothetical protein QOD03_1748, partial [Verrucomicrobiota bacterium]
MPITAPDIQNVVLKEDDFGHEMRVGKIIRSVPGIRFEHGGTYTDPVTNKPRQFDFRCSLRKDDQELHMAVECKNLLSSVPMVMCGTDRRIEESFHDLIEARMNSVSPSRQKHVIYMDGASSATFRVSRENSVYPPNSFVCKSILRIKPNPNKSQSSSDLFVSASDSDIYDSWAQAVSSSVELLQFACETARRYRRPKCYTAVLPIVVVPDSALWIVDYDENGLIRKAPQQVDSGELFIGREIQVSKEAMMAHQFEISHIHFFTLTGFSSFFSTVVSNVEF